MLWSQAVTQTTSASHQHFTAGSALEAPSDAQNHLNMKVSLFGMLIQLVYSKHFARD